MLRLLSLTKSTVNVFYSLTNIQKASISVSCTHRLKEIRETREDKTLIVEGVTVPSPREPYLIKELQDENGPCPLCSLGIHLKHTDVLILSQFVRPDGCMLPQRITGLCIQQQRRVTTLVAMAQKAGLMSNLTPSYSKKDPKKRYRWKKFNTYFDEKTISVARPNLFKLKKDLLK